MEETTMKAENLRWVFHQHLCGVSCFLADENNNPLGFPFLRYLTKEEIKLLDDLGITCSMDPANHFYFDVFPKEYREKVTVTAPAYFKTQVFGDVMYRNEGTFTCEYTNLKDIQFVCETVAANIPQDHIYLSGHYVPISE